MALLSCGRFAGNSVFSSIVRIPTVLAAAQYAAVPKLSIKKYEPPPPEDYIAKNARIARPMSPHLTVYKMKLPSILSVTQRITGMAITSYVTLLGCSALVLPHNVGHYVTMLEGLNLSPVILIILKLCIGYPFSYHYLNGIRYIYWYTGKGLTIKQVYSSGYMMLAAAGVLNIALAFL